MLRKIRIALAVLFFVGITLLFIGIGQDWWGWMAKLQLLPAVFRLAGGFTLGNTALVAGILLLTLVFGRIYCSVICPLGVFQDLVILVRRELGKAVDKMNFRNAKGKTFVGADGKPVRLKPIVKHFSHSPEHRVVRFIVFGLAVASAFACGQLLISIIAPYSAYGRMVAGVVSLCGGAVAPALLITAGVTFVVLALCAWFWGRAWCNTVCPVGTVLGYVSKASLFKIRIDESKCSSCGRCGRGCKASCIDMDAHTVDYSRCVDCFDCIGRCKSGAISFTCSKPDGGSPRKTSASLHPSQPGGWAPPVHEATGGHSFTGGTADPANNATEMTNRPSETADPANNGRREFLASAAGIIAAGAVAKAQEMKVDGGLAPLEAKKAPERSGRLVPPGAWSVKGFYDHCTACQLCVQNCPNGVLKISTDLEHLLQPQMGYENGWCRPECTVCSDVCPAGAIRPIQRDQKTAIKIGTAKVNPELCLAATSEVGCGNCSRHCPTGAIKMGKDAEGRRIPLIAEEQCIGCGACEYLCPSRPLSAITVDGLSTHISK